MCILRNHDSDMTKQFHYEKDNLAQHMGAIYITEVEGIAPLQLTRVTASFTPRAGVNYCVPAKYAKKKTSGAACLCCWEWTSYWPMCTKSKVT